MVYSQESCPNIITTNEIRKHDDLPYNDYLKLDHNNKCLELRGYNLVFTVNQSHHVWTT